MTGANEQVGDRWHLVGRVRQVPEMLIEDDCRIELSAGATASTVRTTNDQYSELDRVIDLHHADQDVRCTALLAIAELVGNQCLFAVQALEAGILTEAEIMAAHDVTWAKIQQRRQTVAEQANEEDSRDPSPLLAVARVCGLDPEPDASKEPSLQWRARCPDTKHHLLIRPSIDQFFCGYCRESGAAEELRDLVDKRRREGPPAPPA